MFRGAGAVIVALEETVQPIASVIVTVYVPAESPVKEDIPVEPLDQEYWKGPVPRGNALIEPVPGIGHAEFEAIIETDNPATFIS